MQDIESHHASMESLDEGRLHATHGYQNGHQGRSSSLRFVKIYLKMLDNLY